LLLSLKPFRGRYAIPYRMVYAFAALWQQLLTMHNMHGPLTESVVSSDSTFYLKTRLG